MEHWDKLREDEKTCWMEGFHNVVGCDEVGRGALAGPVVAGAVILTPEFCLAELRDSKEATPKMRRTWSELIKEKAVAWSIGQVEADEIDLINIHQATLLAMGKAIGTIAVKPDFALVDGRFKVHTTERIPQKAIIKGDVRAAVIAAASIVAKVYRDELMCQYAKIYPEYGFESHKGYGTQSHMQVLRRIGPCPLHRTTYLKFLVKPEQMTIFNFLFEGENAYESKSCSR